MRNESMIKPEFEDFGLGAYMANTSNTDLRIGFSMLRNNRVSASESQSLLNVCETNCGGQYLMLRKISSTGQHVARAASSATNSISSTD
jgi:hypothetical protein